MNCQALVDRYPELYRDLPYGIECGKGWEQLLDDLSQVLVALGPVTVRQVKEKFGQLRFYYTGGNAGVNCAVRMAERLSCYTCEECGRAGRHRTDRAWWVTLCDGCNDERIKRG